MILCISFMFTNRIHLTSISQFNNCLKYDYNSQFIQSTNANQLALARCKILFFYNVGSNDPNKKLSRLVFSNTKKNIKFISQDILSKIKSWPSTSTKAQVQCPAQLQKALIDCAQNIRRLASGLMPYTV